MERSLIDRPKPAGFPDHVILPDYAAMSLPHVPSVIFQALGDSEANSPLAQAVDVGRFERVVLVLIDGLGYRSLNRMIAAGTVPTLANLTRRGAYLPITSVFPSTTVTALTSLATGLAPVAHGMLGYRLYLREIDAITDMIRLQRLDGAERSDAPDLAEILSIPTFCQRLSDQEIASHIVLPRAIAGSGLSQLLYRGCTKIEQASGLPDMCVQVRRVLAEATGPAFVTLYWPGLDTVAHSRGPESEAYQAEAMAIDAILGSQLVDRLEQTLLVLTSDHGMVTMEATDYRELSTLGPVADSLTRLPVGEPRASYLHLREADSSTSGEFGSLEEGLLCIRADRVLASGLIGLGDAHPEARSRIGDELVVSTGTAGLFHPYPGAPRLRGMHGGLTDAEMLVPLIAAPFE